MSAADPASSHTRAPNGNPRSDARSAVQVRVTDSVINASYRVPGHEVTLSNPGAVDHEHLFYTLIREK